MILGQKIDKATKSIEKIILIFEFVFSLSRRAVLMIQDYRVQTWGQGKAGRGFKKY